ncbi:hypothetical protein M3G03_04560 [Aestuariimicrobium sp. p3-SID1156]|uniref:hypothetical protein n=1 Tax=Aestuariimicrobium sp. p3-SID1156 TaxID=2916038 RepID=UPI00223BBC5A|nr:hypothetical protein [Aestuariimicrobium sp. p3-SID1156]MCT1458815.1 hypothetical protein [Aestuariimicrobium sp. p3-SID1156]
MLRSTRSRLGALVAASVVALTGCAQGNPSSAFELGDRRVSMEQLDDYTQACKPLFNDDSAGLTGIRNLVAGSLISEELQARHNLSFSDEQIRGALAQFNQEVGLSVPGCAPLFTKLGGLHLTMAKLTPEKGLAEIEKMDFKVNPRLGTWDSKRLGVVMGGSELSGLAPITRDSGD